MRISDWSSDVCSSDLLIDVLEAACAWFEEQLGSAAGREARDYLAGRGLDPQTVKAFRLGFAPRQRGVLAKALRARGITVDQLIEAGLVKRADRKSTRLNSSH